FHVAHPIGPLTETLAPDRPTSRSAPTTPFIASLPRVTAALHILRPVLTRLPLFSLARVVVSPAKATLSLALVLPALLTPLSAFCSLLALLILSFGTILLAWSAFSFPLVLAFATILLLPVSLVLLSAGLTLTLAPSLSLLALPFLARLSS